MARTARAPGQGPSAGRAGALSAREALLLLPNVGRLLWRLARDRRVPLATKLLVAGTGLYLAVPFDIIPDWIPVLGYLDDVILVGLVLRRLVRSVPADVLAEHWQGSLPLPELVGRLSRRAPSQEDREGPPRAAK